MLRVFRPRWWLPAVIAGAGVMGCGGRLVNPDEPPDDPSRPPIAKLSGEKTGDPTPPKASTSGRIDDLFGGTGSSVLPAVGQLPVCILTSAKGSIWLAARPLDDRPESLRRLVQLDARGSLDPKVASYDGSAGELGELVGLEACARTSSGELVVAHRGGRLGATELARGPGLAYVSRLVATTPEVLFDTIVVPFAATAIEVEADGTYVLAADRDATAPDLDLARVRRDGTWLGRVDTPPMPGFRVRRLARDGNAIVVAGVVDGKDGSPSAAIGRVEDGRLAWAPSRVGLDIAASVAPRDRFGLSLDDQGHAYIAIGPGVLIGRFLDGGAALDRSYGEGGQVQLGRDGVAWDAVASAGGRLVVATSTGLVRLQESGQLDRSYGEGGKAPIHLATSLPLRVARAPDGAVLLAGLGAAGAIEVTRYTP